MKTVAIVVPRPNEVLTPDEEISLRHLDYHLSEYDRFFVVPEHVSVQRRGFDSVKFAGDAFASHRNYDRFMLTPYLYEAFQEYEHILIYQLDCLVFSDRLLDFCGLDYDYIGAPWMRRRGVDAWELDRVGNGGLSLRRIDAFLSVLHSRRYVDQRKSLWRDMLNVRVSDMHFRQNSNPIWKQARKVRELLKIRQGVESYLPGYSRQEDYFWSDRAVFFNPGFHVAPIDVGLRFAFERAPRLCYEINGGTLPFGAHAWAKWDRAFWEPFLLK